MKKETTNENAADEQLLKETAAAKQPVKETGVDTQPEKEDAAKDQEKKEDPVAPEAKAPKPPKAKKPKETMDIRILRTPMDMLLGYHPGEEIKGYDLKKAQELIERGYAEKI